MNSSALIVSYSIFDTGTPVSSRLTVKTPKVKRDPRSSLVDMEFDEHSLRLKILQIEYEEALIKKEIVTERKRHEVMLHQLQVKKAELEIDKLIEN